MADLTMMLLGPSGAGKTLLTTVFYRERNPQTVDINDPRKDPLKDTWTLDLSHENMQQFSQANFSIDNDGSENFASATLAIHEWNFIAHVEGASSKINVFSFRFVDYPGEWLQRADIDASSVKAVPQVFGKYVEDSQVLFGVLDGEDVLAFLKGDMKSAEFDALYNEVLLHIGIAEVKHIIISKYDVLSSAGLSWSDVLTGLKKWGKLAEFIRRGRGSGIRIIPVSALEGKVQNDGYHINKKIKAGHLKPINANIPLALALQLAVKLKYDELKKRNRKNLLKYAKFASSRLARLIASSGQATLNTLHGIIVGIKFLIGGAVLAFFGTVISAIVAYYAQYPLAFLVVGLLALVGLFFLVRALRQRRKEAALGRRKNIKTQKDALAMVTASLIKEVNEFDKEFPGSQLN